MKENSTYIDLAHTVHNKIKNAKVNSKVPNEETLIQLFENLFFASLKTEEAEFIKVTMTFIDSQNPDPNPPEKPSKNRWKYTAFEKPIEFNVKNIVKLSKAADPWSSSLAIDIDSLNNLSIWGLIDQAVHYQSYLNYEIEDGPEQPGLFQATITGVGNLLVILDYQLIATLKQNVLVNSYLNVFKIGEISVLLKACMSSYKQQIQILLDEDNFDSDTSTEWKSDIESFWIQTLSRILIRTQNYNHGGAFLITNNFAEDLEIKHKIEYDRLFTSMCNWVFLAISYNYYSEEIGKQIGQNTLSMDTYLDEWVSNSDKLEVNDEIKGAVRFIASLSGIDGLVLLSGDLKVHGFGTVIKNLELPPRIYLSKKSVVSESSLVAVNPNNFGTRHQSMFSYCWKHEGSVGFVISQDGDVRAITKVQNKLVMWENIKIQQHIQSSKLKVPASQIRKKSE